MQNLAQATFIQEEFLPKLDVQDILTISNLMICYFRPRTLLGAPGLTTRGKDATRHRGSGLLRLEFGPSLPAVHFG